MPLFRPSDDTQATDVGLSWEFEGGLRWELWKIHTQISCDDYTCKLLSFWSVSIIILWAYQCSWETETFSKVFTEKLRLGHFCLPPFCVVLSHLLWEGDKYDKDKETLEGHKDSEDVSEGKESVNFYHQNTNDPSYPHHNSERDWCLQPMPAQKRYVS